MNEHHHAADHEHLPGDGHETVVHEDHVDHIHDGQAHTEEHVHPEHGAAHHEGDGHETVVHEDHVDHIHDGHQHFQHGDHVHEH